MAADSIGLANYVTSETMPSPFRGVRACRLALGIPLITWDISINQGGSDEFESAQSRHAVVFERSMPQ